MGWLRESDPAPSPTSVILRMVRIDSSSGYDPVLLGPFQLINLMLGVLSLPVTAAFAPRWVSGVWQADKRPQFSNFALIQAGVGGKGEWSLPRCFAKREAGQGLCMAERAEELRV